MFDLISIGDCVIDHFIPLTEAEVISHGEEFKLCLRYGAKIPVGPSISMIGGNATNNVIGSSKLKLKSSIYINIGSDSDDHRIISKLKEIGVDTRYIVHHKDMPSTHHFVLDFKGERTILVYHQPWKYNLPDLDPCKWLYLTSLSPSFVDSNIYNQIINYLERTSSKLFFNPGTFQIKMGIRKNARLLSLTEVFIVNLEEAKLLLGYEEEEKVNIKKLLKGIGDLGPRMVVITDGREGSYGFDGEKYFKLEIFPTKLVEATGAGDAYASGTLAGLFHGESLAEAMRWGTANGSSVVEKIGSTEGLLSYSQMKEKLKEFSEIKAKEI